MSDLVIFLTTGYVYLLRKLRWYLGKDSIYIKLCLFMALLSIYCLWAELVDNIVKPKTKVFLPGKKAERPRMRASPRQLGGA